MVFRRLSIWTSVTISLAALVPYHRWATTFFNGVMRDGFVYFGVTSRTPFDKMAHELRRYCTTGEVAPC